MTEAVSKLGQDKIGSLLLRYTGPAIAGLLVFGLGRLIGNALVGRYLGTVALAGYTVANAVAMIVLACGLLLATGSSILISTYLGANRRKDAQNVLSVTLFLSILGGIGLSILGFLFLKPMLIAFGGEGDVLTAATDFTRVFLLGCCFQLLITTLNYALRAEGHPLKALAASYLSLFLNVAFMILFTKIIPLGIGGIALANIISSLLVSLWQLGHFLGSKATIHLTIFRTKCMTRLIPDILKIGFPTFTRQMIQPMISILSNHIAMTLGGETALAVTGVVVTIYFSLIMPVQGIAMGIQPIISYNYGSKQYQRALHTVTVGIAGCCIISLAETLMILPFREQIAGIFLTEHPDLAVYTGRGVLLALLAFPIAGIQYIGINAFQSTGQASLALKTSLLRSGLSAILLVILSYFFGMDGLFVNVTVCDVIMTIVVGGLLWVEFHRKFSQR